MASLRCQMISKKLVKPSFPTPPSLRNYKLSFIDQLMTNRYVPMAFFYPNQQHTRPDDNTQIYSRLEESLSKTLASYYPFAGRLTDNISINCNDMGATFLEARIRCPMSEILKGPNINAQDIIYPSGLSWSYAYHQQSLVVAQLSHFDCGGKALSVCMSHKVVDGPTICNFINDWAAMTRQSSEKPSPNFMGASILPPNDDIPIEPEFELQQEHNCITRRYVFDPYKLSQLKVKATAEVGVHKPTRVEVVTALLYKCAMTASMVHRGSFKPSALTFAVNLRPLIGIPATENYAGNFVTCSELKTYEREMNFSRLVSAIRRLKVEQYEKYKGIKTNDLIPAICEDVEKFKLLQSNNDIDWYNTSSLCRFPTYLIDFGWGRPISVSLAAVPQKNLFHLMDNNNSDGIEALVTLEEKVMSVFQSDPELLAFASPGSSF